MLVSPPAAAWEPVAHEAIAIVARHRLNSATLEATRKILGQDASGRQLELEDVAGCPDGFAHNPGFKCAGTFELEGKPSESAPWHFINIPISAKDPKPSDYCAKSGCVWSQIDRELAVLRDENAPSDAKRSALAFVVHLVGDVHQPLHCADDRDFGGNKKLVDVEYHGQKIPLHKVWDEALMPPSQVDWRLPSDQLALRAQWLAGQLERDLATRSRAQVSDWTRGDLVTRATLEGWTIAKDKIYPRYAKDRGAIADDRHEAVGARYQREMEPIARERLETAGVRLAALLEGTLVPPKP